MHNRDKVIGVLGGMGPEATSSFFQKLIVRTPVEKDQDHYRIVIDNNPKIPDRTAAIIADGPSPVPEMQKTAKNLEAAGAEVIAIPCMTAHYFRSDVQSAVDVPILNAYELLNDHLLTTYSDLSTVGVLSTTGSRHSKQFERYLTKFTVVFPSEASQESKVMEAIYGEEGIKNGHLQGKSRSLLQSAAKELVDMGAEVIISGCTEIELALKPDDVPVPLIDPMTVMADVLTDSSQ